ncbi:MAG: ABC transporter permease [Pseudomonadota bacterium]
MADTTATSVQTATSSAPSGFWRFVRRNPTLVVGLVILIGMVFVALAAPFMAGDPLTMKPIDRLKPPSEQFWFGTDQLGRDVFARTLWGARISLVVGISVALLSVAIGLAIGLLAGVVRWIEAAVMRLLDGLMAIPSILLAIAMVSLFGASVGIVIIAIVIPEIPRVVRLVRSVVLATREQPYVEAAIAGGAPMWKILVRHILPPTIPPLIVQATYICASAILVEAALSFLGAGTPPEIPTWGNMIAADRIYLGRAPWCIFCPGIALALVVLAVNLVGDGLRDRLDPRIARRM